MRAAVVAPMAIAAPGFQRGRASAIFLGELTSDHCDGPVASPDLATSASIPNPNAVLGERAPLVAALGAYAVLFAPTFAGLVQQWWQDPDAGHGLLLVPVAFFLAWRTGIAEDARPDRALGVALLLLAVVLRLGGSLAAELFAQRAGMLLAGLGLVVFHSGGRQLLRWWLPVGLLALSIPLPTVVLNELAFPLQLRASRMGAAMLAWRRVPVELSGNVISIPGHQLFVTEACSGLRSLTALLSLGLLLGGLWLRSPWMRGLLLVLAMGVAVLVNGVRVFLTAFLVYFVSPAMGEGFMHTTEGWLLFVVSLGAMGLVTWMLSSLERRRAAVHA
jgi:exosortase